MTREEAKKRIKKLLRWYLKEEPMSETMYEREAVNMAIEALSAEPQTAEWEVYEVLHGEWEGTKKYRCPRCKQKFGVFNTNFCPECGLKMSNGKSWERSNMEGDKHE